MTKLINKNNGFMDISIIIHLMKLFCLFLSASIILTECSLSNLKSGILAIVPDFKDP